MVHTAHVAEVSCFRIVGGSFGALRLCIQCFVEKGFGNSSLVVLGNRD